MPHHIDLGASFVDHMTDTPPLRRLCRENEEEFISRILRVWFHSIFTYERVSGSTLWNENSGWLWCQVAPNTIFLYAVTGQIVLPLMGEGGGG